jgi:hypothetical protein
MKYVVVVLVAGCAETTTTCPVGTKLTVSHADQGRAEWCQVEDSSLANMPTPSRTSSLVLPPALPFGVDGPFTAWYGSGVEEAHGTYRNVGSRSVPEGLWAFWYPSGAPEVVGHYHQGAPVGCFAVWDEHGARHTGMVTGTELHVQDCPPPSDAELAALEGHVAGPAKAPWGDASVAAFAGPSRFGVANDSQVAADPGMQLAFTATARLRLGHVRIGPSFGIRTTDIEGYTAYTGALAVAWQLPTFHPRLDFEIGAELGVERLTVTAERMGTLATAQTAFWAPLPAVEAAASFSLTPELAAVLGVRVDGVPARTVNETDTYCDDFGNCANADESWRVGAIAAGATLGLRLLFR